MKLRASRVASFRCFQKEGYANSCGRSLFPGGLRVITQRLRTDATNSRVFKEKKLNVLDLQTEFTSRPIFLSDTWGGLRCLGEQRRCLGQLQICNSSGDANHMLGMVDKQILSLHGAGWPSQSICRVFTPSPPALTDGLPDQSISLKGAPTKYVIDRIN